MKMFVGVCSWEYVHGSLTDENVFVNPEDLSQVRARPLQHTHTHTHTHFCGAGDVAPLPNMYKTLGSISGTT